MSFPFKYNFSQGTTKNINYMNSPEYMEALKLLCQSVKRRDTARSEDLQKRGMRRDYGLINDGVEKVAKAVHGDEFFFSNIMVKVY